MFNRSMLKFENLGYAIRATLYRNGKPVGFVVCDERVAEEMATMHAALVRRDREAQVHA